MQHISADVFSIIVLKLQVKDIISFQLTCKKFYNMHVNWKNLNQRDFLNIRCNNLELNGKTHYREKYKFWKYFLKLFEGDSKILQIQDIITEKKQNYYLHIRKKCISCKYDNLCYTMPDFINKEWFLINKKRNMKQNIKKYTLIIPYF